MAASVAVPTERIRELRQAIHSRVTSDETKQRIRACVERAGCRKTLDETSLLRVLEEDGVVGDILASLDQNYLAHSPKRPHPTIADTQPSSQQQQENNPAVAEGRERRCLVLHVLGGRAFLDYLHDVHDAYPSSSLPFFTLHVYFRGQRFVSSPVQCSCEPDIRETFLLELTKQTREKLELTDALSISDNIHLVLTRSISNGGREMVGSCHVEWRQVLAEQRGWLDCSLEVCGVASSEPGVPAGVLDVRLELFSKEIVPLEKKIVSAQLKLERQQVAERDRLFLLYAKQWWKEYLQIRPSHNERRVKIFAQDEEGTMKFVCGYVQPMMVGRLLESPREAVRFVSLLSYERPSSVGSGLNEVWNSLHTVLSVKKGDCEEHSVLLCSLLIAFGLNAFVCIGTKIKRLAHCWVVTINIDGSATFWESLTGQRYHHPVFDPNSQAGKPIPAPSHPYRTVGCVFNHQSFYANSHHSDSALTCVFDLQDHTLWKPMSKDAIVSITSNISSSCWSSLPPLMPSQVDSAIASFELESQLKALVVQHRMDAGLTTVWDDQLSYMLAPALVSYETERTVGVSAGNEEFQEAVRRAVPEGNTFKGFPIQFNHRNQHNIFVTCLRSPVCSEILNCRGDNVQHAVRVRITCYPEDLCAVWVMFAVKYTSIV